MRSRALTCKLHFHDIHRNTRFNTQCTYLLLIATTNELHVILLMRQFALLLFSFSYTFSLAALWLFISGRRKIFQCARIYLGYVLRYFQFFAKLATGIFRNKEIIIFVDEIEVGNLSSREKEKLWHFLKQETEKLNYNINFSLFIRALQ